MGLNENLVEIKSQTEALLEFANEITGASDVRLGDAIRTLASGFGGMAIGTTVKYGEFSPTSVSTTMSFSVGNDVNNIIVVDSVITNSTTAIWVLTDLVSFVLRTGSSGTFSVGGNGVTLGKDEQYCKIINGTATISRTGSSNPISGNKLRYVAW